MKINLENLLFENKMRATELSKKSGVPESTISKIINGKRIPSLETIIKFCDVLGCGIEDIVLLEKKNNLKVA